MKSGTSVLVVEDDDWFAEQQTRTLRKSGFDVTHVSHGLAAIEAFDQKKIDVLVLDIFLPGPNAVTLLHEMQSYTDLAAVPVIVCSNSARELPETSLKEFGVRAILDKTSMHPEDLVDAVKRVLA